MCSCALVRVVQVQSVEHLLFPLLDAHWSAHINPSEGVVGYLCLSVTDSTSLSRMNNVLTVVCWCQQQQLRVRDGRHVCAPERKALQEQITSFWLSCVDFLTIHSLSFFNLPVILSFLHIRCLCHSCTLIVFLSHFVIVGLSGYDLDGSCVTDIDCF